MASLEKFAELRKTLQKGKVLLPGDDDYDVRLRRWSATCVKPAAAVAMPASAEEASAIVKFAVANNIAFNVRGGGHSTSQASSAPSPEGMVLDLGLLRNVSVDTEKQMVTFGGGCLWGDVDDALAPHGLATPGGTVSHTGVGGLILHGGFGVLTGLHGLTIDCLISCEVVLADGSIVTASDKENTDLFWALRGAGSSFGVVTSFTSKAFRQGDVYLGIKACTPDKIPAIVNFMNHWHATTDGSTAIMVFITHAPIAPGTEPPPGGPPRVVSVLFGHFGADAETAGPAYFEHLVKIECLFQDVGMKPYAAANKLNDDKAFRPEERYQFGGSNFTLPTSVETVQTLAETWWDLTAPEKGLNGSLLVLEGIPGNASRKVPVDAMAFNSRGEYYNIGLVWHWKNPSMDSEVRLLNRQVQDETRKLGYNDSESKDGVGRYLNYVAGGLDAKDAFGENARKLRELKQKYDPTNVFDTVWKLLAKKEEQYAL
ncbi:hypothetical protein NLU13_8166 [Sarocladium strictum]|uniref:FAD-binding PCMH-type domain-containing protein n=1 Tax=Sarocladium strictum TaxID=5046 RepID=A0AA39L4Q5_SARSR|nr:hypothetical protein NLU13_8166 [Sarocladium strictum]